MLENPTQSEQKCWRLLAGADLRARRIQLGLSQAGLARILGVQRTTILDVESKSADDLSVLWRLAIRALIREPELFADNHQLERYNSALRGSEHE
jgi:transcriptional regulator with XRE-family HTH domain